MKLSKPQQKLLQALAAGATLKSHRYLDGRKVAQLHPLDGPAETVRWSTVQTLIDRGLIDSNKKFPAATYLLTEQGWQAVEHLTKIKSKPLSAKNF
jgi:uncharacterized protein YjhX (UPF0386 family)